MPSKQEPTLDTRLADPNVAFDALFPASTAQPSGDKEVTGAKVTKARGRTITLTPATTPPWIAVYDPRPELGQTTLWSKLLRAAYEQSGDDPRGAYGVLDGVRAQGAALRQGTERWQIVRGEMSEEEWATCLVALRSVGEAVRALLAVR